MPIDMTAATSVKAPPRKIASTSKTSAKVATDTRTEYEKRVEGLDGLGQLGQGICIIAQQYADAAAVGKYWPPISIELSKLAETNKSVATTVDFLIGVGPYGALIAAVLPLALQIGANHKLVDAERMSSYGIVVPEVLEAQMKAEMLRMQAQAMMEQQHALKEAQRAQEMYERAVRETQQNQNGAE